MEKNRNGKTISAERGGQMTDEEMKELIEMAAESAAQKVIRSLKASGRIRQHYTNSFKKTEELLYLYPKLDDENETKKKVDRAMDAIRADRYFGIISSKYFEGLTFEQISEIYDCKYQNISKNRARLVKKLAAELFPEDVLKELLEI